jgi:hypothetical protein
MTEPRKVVVTMTGPWPAPVQTVIPIEMSAWQFLRRFAKASADADTVVLRGTSGLHERYVELLAALWLKVRANLTRKPPPLTLMSDATWDVTSRRLEQRLPALSPLLPKVARLAVRAFDGPHVRYGVLSCEEKDAFPERWGIDAHRVFFTPFCATMPFARRSLATDEGYVFAGGNSYRDYELLVAAAALIDVPVRIASSWRPAKLLPPNVVVHELSPAEYDKEMLGASVVVVPIRIAERSAGQQTYLNEAPGVRDHVQDGVTALVSAPDPAALATTIERAVRGVDDGSLAALAERGRKLVEGYYHMTHYYQRLWSAAGLALRPPANT